MLSFSDDTTWVHADDREEPLHMRIPIVLKLAVIHYYAVTTFSYVSMPVDTFEGQLIDYGLVYTANTDVHYWRNANNACETALEMVQLALTAKGQEFLRKVPQAVLVAELISHQFSPDRDWRWYPYEVPSDDVYSVAAAFMIGLEVPELPQFLSHEISTIREKAHELLMTGDNFQPVNKLQGVL